MDIYLCIKIFSRVQMPEQRRSTSGCHVCLITPGQPSTNPRLVKEADALVEAGYSVSVICGDFINWARLTDREFADRGWRVHVRVLFGPASGFLRRAWRKGRGVIARALFRAGRRSPKVLAAAWHEIGPELIDAARRLQADLYISHYPAALPAAAEAARRNGAKFAFDAEDFHPGDLPDSAENKSTNALLEAIEERYLPLAAYVTAAAPLIAKAYAEEYGIKAPTVVLNTFPLEQAAENPTLIGIANPRPSIYWFSQTIGPNRGLEAAVEAIGIAKSNPHLYLRGHPQQGYIGKLWAAAERNRCANRLHILEIAPPSEMAELAAKYDIGLASEVGETANRRIALANKTFTYLLGGVPVLLSNIPAHLGLGRELGAACQIFPVDDAFALAECIDHWLLDATRLQVAREHAFRLGQERYNWEIESRWLLNCVAYALDEVPTD